MEAYSKEFRRDVLAAGDAGEGTRSVALRFDVSESWVRRGKQERREEGKVAPQKKRRSGKIWEPYAEWLLAKLDERPDVYLRELQAAAQAELGWKVSDVTLSRACRAPRRTRNKRRVLRRSSSGKTLSKRADSGQLSNRNSNRSESCSSMKRGPRPI